MKIKKKIVVPTGEIYTAMGEKGLLEFLTVGDYGKNANIKADFLGITRDLNGVPNGEPMPLTEKWVITISTQYGCSMGCKFCDVPKVGIGRNATFNDLKEEALTAIKQHPEVKHTKRLNIHYARMGEPTWNANVLLHAICIKNEFYKGDAGLQFSINTTNDEERNYLFSGSSLSLGEVSEIGKSLPMPVGRKYALNFALADDTHIDGKRLRELFNPDKFMCKITPLHRTNSCDENDLHTSGGYELFTPYKAVEEDLKDNGFDVIVFVPSYDEDNGLITCGNAILSGKVPTSSYQETTY